MVKVYKYALCELKIFKHVMKGVSTFKLLLVIKYAVGLMELINNKYSAKIMTKY